MQLVLLVIHLIIAVAMVITILLQRNSSDGLSGIGGGGNSGAMQGRASANLLTRTTAILATLFIVNSLVLATLSSRNSTKSSVLDSVISEQQKTTEEQPKPAAQPEETTPSVPVAE